MHNECITITILILTLVDFANTLAHYACFMPLGIGGFAVAASCLVPSESEKQ